MSTYSDLLSYYAGLLVAQYNGLPKASATIQALVAPILMGDGQGSTLPLDVLNGYNLNATVQTLSFSALPASGSFKIGYGSSTTAALAYNCSSDAILAELNTLLGFKAATPSGSPASQNISISFSVPSAPQIVYVTSNSLLDSNSSPVTVAVTTNLAIGAQLDVLGKYVGVVRRGVGANGQSITLNDFEFWQLILIAIASNNSSSTLYAIDQFFATFFPGIISVFDYANTAPMQMSYLINTSSVSNNIIQLMLAEGLLPVPMAVEYSVIGAPSITGFITFPDYYVNDGAQPANTGMLNNNSGYVSADINASFLWLDYSYALKLR